MNEAAATADPQPIRTARLALISMSVPFMEALARGEADEAARELDASVPEWMPNELRHFLTLRLSQLAIDASIREWLGRTMVITEKTGVRRAIGQVGFHGPPDQQGRLEVGYSVDPAYRRRGYASEAIAALFDWAHVAHGIDRFIASISPDNEPSLRLAEKLGFVQVGSQMDEIDGLELVFETTWPPRARAGATSPAARH